MLTKRDIKALYLRLYYRLRKYEYYASDYQFGFKRDIKLF